MVAENTMVDPSSVIPVDNVEGTILDFDDTRTLYKGIDDKVRIKNRTDGTETIIYDAPYNYLGKSLLTPAGAVVNVYTGHDYGELFLWYSGQLKATGVETFSGYGSEHSTVQTDGKFAFSDWTGDLIDTETGEIRNFGRVGYAALAADGSLVAANNEGIILFQPDGTSRQLIKTSLEYPSPVFDGKTVLLNTNSRDILKYADGSLTMISKSSYYDDTTSPHSDFEIDQGWIAYTKPASSGRRQIFLESPQGTVTQVTYFNGNSKIRALNKHGTLAITYNSELYMYHPGDKEPKKLTSDSYYHLAPSYHNGTWYQAVEGTLFLLNYGPTVPGDTTAPQWPGTDALSVADVTYHSALLNWQPATDETGVEKYLVYQDNTLLDTLNRDVNSYNVKGLSPNSSYLFSLVAVDAAGNLSVKQEVTVTTAAYPAPGSFQLSDSKTYSDGWYNYEYSLYYGYISSSGQELSGSWSPPEGFHGVVKVSMASPEGEDYDLSLETVGEGNQLPEDTTLLTSGTEYSAAEVPSGYRAEWRVKGHTGNDYSPDKKVFVYVYIRYDNH
ncbi:fibronectin type III domain-containing protein [Paenibacillus harenae]|uniref:fibronectin type III domain-containing protein n=1 Tax=Paenibacillus harenae TaxID=306543 RepID=UPI00146B9330|nr:fibronectin type III domain-containing protein [Paenibacillus harenae]